MPNRLLLADEDAKTLRVLEVNLRGAGFDVTSVTTGAAAWVTIDQELPQVILAATTLAALDGFELCSRVRARQGGADVAFLLLGDDDTLALRIKSIEAGADDYLLKPLYVQEVVARVRALVQRRDRETFTASARAAEAFAGQLSDLSVVDLLQVIADSRRAGIVHLRGAREVPATIYFRQGQVVDAEVGRLSGINAISRLFSWTTGSFEVQWKPIRRPNAIGLSTPDLVLEGMKRLDERNRLAGGLPDLDGVFEVNYRVLAERLSEIPDEVNAVLRLFDGSRTLAHVVEDCQLPDPEAMAIAIRLRDEGIIHNVSRPGASAGSGALIVPPRPAGRAPSADDVTVVRRITSQGTGSGPVQQSYASATAARAAVSAPSAETVVAPMPAEPGSFDEVDGVIPSENHAKTDPGLGKPLALSDLDPSGRSPEHAAADAVPAARVAAPGAEVTAPNAAAPPAAAWPEDQHASTESLPSVEPEAPDGDLAELAAGLDADPSSLRTQRGIGPFPDLFQPQAAAAPASGPGAPAAADPSETTRPIELEAASSANGVMSAATDLDGPAEPSPAAVPAGAAGPTVAQAPAAAPRAMPVDFVDDELSEKEALDELGVSGWKRGVRLIVGLAVAGALTAVVVHKLHRSPAAPLAPSASAERTAAPAQVPVEPATAVPSPPAEKAAPTAPSPTAEKASGEGQAQAAPSAPAAENRGADQAALAKGDSDKPGSAEKSALAGVAPPVPAAPPVAGSPDHAGAPADKAVAAAAPTRPAPAVDFTRQLATCRSQFLRDRIREAATTCAAALEANPGSADALTMMAHVELNRGHLGRANDLAQKSIGIDPNQADAYVIIGGVHQDSGRNPQAKVAYRRYLQLAPHGRYADEVRSIVGSL